MAMKGGSFRIPQAVNLIPLKLAVLLPLLRLGSGASGFHGPGAPDTASTAHSRSDASPSGIGSRMFFGAPALVPFRSGPLPASEGNPSLMKRAVSLGWLSVALSLVILAFVGSLVCLMMGQGGQSRDDDNSWAGSLRDPPRWDPSMERRQSNPYTFDTWSRDVMMWSLCTSVRQGQQAAAVAMRLSGAARDVVRELQPAQLTQGDFIGTPPRHVDALTFLMHHLSVRFAPLAEETALRAVSDLTTFARRPGEQTDAFLTRYEGILS